MYKLIDERVDWGNIGNANLLVVFCWDKAIARCTLWENIARGEMLFTGYDGELDDDTPKLFRRHARAARCAGAAV